MISKIEGPGSVRTSSPVRRAAKTAKTKGAGFSQLVGGAEEVEGASGTAAASSIGTVTGVYGLQEVDDALARAAKGTMRAEDILDRLQDLRLALLEGALPPDRLRQLSHVVSLRRPEVSDPRLGEILDEIDLRAQVELAKFGDQP
jgi:hypothetical protein